MHFGRGCRGLSIGPPQESQQLERNSVDAPRCPDHDDEMSAASARPAAPWRGRILSIAAGLFLCHLAGTAWHELVGHGLVGIAFGGRIEGVHILGFQLYPTVKWDGWTGQYGSCDLEGIDTPYGMYWMLLGGSLSTFVVAAIATVLLWIRSWGRWSRALLLWLSLWWIDMLTYLAPTWGLRRSILWGGRYSEPYDAAVRLGIPGGFFQVFVVVSCALMAITTILFLTRGSVRAFVQAASSSTVADG